MGVKAASPSGADTSLLNVRSLYPQHALSHDRDRVDATHDHWMDHLHRQSQRGGTAVERPGGPPPPPPPTGLEEAVQGTLAALGQGALFKTRWWAC